jgi:hypothetical protein
MRRTPFHAQACALELTESLRRSFPGLADLKNIDCFSNPHVGRGVLRYGSGRRKTYVWIPVWAADLRANLA